MNSAPFAEFSTLRENSALRSAAVFLPRSQIISLRAAARVKFLPERQEDQLERQFALHSASCGTPQSFFCQFAEFRIAKLHKLLPGLVLGSFTVSDFFF